MQLKEIQGHCPTCNADREASIEGSYQTSAYDENGVGGSTDYRILRCKGCNTVYFQEYILFSEDVDYSYDRNGETLIEYIPTINYWPPKVKKNKPEWLGNLIEIDEDLFNLLEEVYAGFNSDLKVLASIGIRTVFDRASELLGIDPGISFIKKLNMLVANGLAGEKEKESLSTLTEAGSAAAHRAWKPTNEILDLLLDTIEHFIYRNFILHKRIKAIDAEIPRRKSF